MRWMKRALIYPSTRGYRCAFDLMKFLFIVFIYLPTAALK